MNKTKRRLTLVSVLVTLITVVLSESPFMLILAYIIHEAGHIVFAKAVGAEIVKFRGDMFHLSMSYSMEGLSYKKEALIYSGGIIFNVIFAALSLMCEGGIKDTPSPFFVFNLSLALMNLYPVSILDGGGIMKSLLNTKLNQETTEKISFGVSFLFALIMWLVAVYLQIIFQSNFSLLFISILLLIQLCFSI